MAERIVRPDPDDLPEGVDGFMGAAKVVERRAELADELCIARVMCEPLLDTGQRFARAVEGEQSGGEIVACIQMPRLRAQCAAVAVERAFGRSTTGEGDAEIVMRVRIVRTDLGCPLKQRGRIVKAALLTAHGAKGDQRIEVPWCLAEQPLQQPLGTFRLTQLQGCKGLTQSRFGLVVHSHRTVRRWMIAAGRRSVADEGGERTVAVLRRRA